MKRKFSKHDIMEADGEGDSEMLVLVEKGKWEDEGKYQYQGIVFQAKDDGKFYLYSLTKSGSYFTEFTYSYEWEQDEIELREVEKSTKTIEYWKAV